MTTTKYTQKLIRRRDREAGQVEGWYVIDTTTGETVGKVHGLFNDAEDAATRLNATTNRSYTTKTDSFYGTGRVYNSQRGATQYDNGTGTYDVQVWDNS